MTRFCPLTEVYVIFTLLTHPCLLRLVNITQTTDID